MAERSGAGGAIGWLLLGLLGGIAVTLAAETLMFRGHGHQDVRDDAASAAPQRMSVPLAPITTPMATPHAVKTASDSPAATHYSAPQPEGEVADDAAAAGMTTRRAPDSAPPR
jgi:hypothetical protein